MKKKEWTTVDMAKMGLHADTGGLELEASELSLMKHAFKANKATIEGTKFTVRKKRKDDPDKHPLLLILQKDKFSKKWFFNIEGNPVGHITGSAIFGYSNAAWVLKGTYVKMLQFLAEGASIQMPESLINKARRGEIYLYALEFATYTTKMTDDIKRLISAWQAMYRMSDWKALTGIHESLDKLLNVCSRNYKTEYETSFAIATLEPQSKNQLIGLAFYDKKVELNKPENKGLHIDNSIGQAIDGRIRIDVNFSARYLSNRKIRTIARLEHVVNEDHNGSWIEFVHSAVRDVIHKSCLQYMLTCPNIFVSQIKKTIPEKWADGTWKNKNNEGKVDQNLVDSIKRWASVHGVRPDVSYKAHVAMLFGRALCSVYGPEKVEALEDEKKMALIMKKAHLSIGRVDKRLLCCVQSLGLETGEVHEI